MYAAVAEPVFASDSVELDIAFGAPRRQRRGTVALRGLLVLPQLVVVVVLAFVGTVLAFIGWFAALALGRLPEWIADIELNVIAYSVRVHAYAFMLVDEYPPFSFWAPDYPIAVPMRASPLSRLKVFFRLLLAIPANIVIRLAGAGLLVLSPIIWLSTLVLGRPPQPLFGAAAAVIRYRARYSAYMNLVTDAYPGRLFGDAEWVWDSEEPAGERRLRLSKGAKRVVVLMLVLGPAMWIGGIILAVATRPPPNPAVVAAERKLAWAELHAVAACRYTNLGCQERHERVLGEAYLRFASSLSRISFPRSQRRSVLVVIHDARQVGQLLLAASRSKDGGRTLGIDPADPPDSPAPAALNAEIGSVLGAGPGGWFR